MENLHPSLQMSIDQPLIKMFGVKTFEQHDEVTTLLQDSLQTHLVVDKL
jgi:hypothetical protein